MSDYSPRAGAWRIDLICCGRDDGAMFTQTWEQADGFRESYCTGPGVSVGGSHGHVRSAIVSRSADLDECEAILLMRSEQITVGWKSDCCGAEMTTAGGDGSGLQDRCWAVCRECGEPCDPKPIYEEARS